MKKQIIQAVVKFWEWIKHYLWTKPTSKPPKTEPIRTMATDVAKDYIVITYRGQRINMHRVRKYPVWKLSSRHDKRATMQRYAKLEKDGLIKFVDIEGQLVCVQNRDYQARADKKKEGK